MKKLIILVILIVLLFSSCEYMRDLIWGEDFDIMLNSGTCTIINGNIDPYYAKVSYTDTSDINIFNSDTITLISDSSSSVTWDISWMGEYNSKVVILIEIYSDSEGINMTETNSIEISDDTNTDYNIIVVPLS